MECKFEEQSISEEEESDINDVDYEETKSFKKKRLNLSTDSKEFGKSTEEKLFE